ncbi:MAG: ATP-binding domain-containing protein, partial [Clostridia bacterium]|nr:ATP-binding domain-containing protein [Clostridia bacterium]
EQNYRSTDVILNAANEVIANNMERKPKKLWTTKKNGELIKYYRAENERDEAYYISGEIQRRIREEHKNYKDFAVLYRANSQSRVIEEYMLKFGIPYNVYGGFKFYSRKEIKDAIAYLTVCVNPDDDISMRRIINTPKRGIGETTIQKLLDFGAQERISLYDAVCRCEEAGLNAGTAKKLHAFEDMINQFIAYSAIMPLGELVEKLINDSGMLKSYEETKTEENLSKRDNLLELVTVARDFEQAEESVSLGDFLENVLLVTDLDNSDDDDDKVSLMTLHSAKGLEFPVVFIAGMENGLFPSNMSKEENRLEEERRLCYVGMTRAKESLYLTNAYARNRFGTTESAMPSPFIDEISDRFLEKSNRWGDTAPRNEDYFGDNEDYSFGGYAKKGRDNLANEPVGSLKYVSSMAKPKNKEIYDFAPGQKVYHERFGEGTVIKVDGSGANALISVAFDGQGIKKLSTAFAPLKPL